MKKEIDYRQNQKVIATLQLEDRGQDFTELDVLENGVILGNSIMFSHGRLSLIGVGTLDGSTYYTLKEMTRPKHKVSGLYIYIKETGEKDPLPWDADTLKYRIIKVKKATKANRFIKKI
jgi:hypothetical protein